MNNFPLVMFCCNDPDNGNPTGRLNAVELQVEGESVLTIEGPLEEVDDELVDLTPIEIHDDHLVVAGRRFEHWGTLSWVGNWCWDACIMQHAAAVELLNHLLAAGGWSVTEGESRLFGKWQAGTPLSVADLAAAVA